MENKRGWIRILEATIAVLIVSGVLVIVYSGHDFGSQGIDEYTFNLQNKILRDISSNDELRKLVLSNNPSDFEELNLFVSQSIPQPPFDYALKICNINDPCKLDLETFKETIGKEIYSENIIISATPTNYDPKKVHLFLWEI